MTYLSNLDELLKIIYVAQHSFYNIFAYSIYSFQAKTAHLLDMFAVFNLSWKVQRERNIYNYIHNDKN